MAGPYCTMILGDLGADVVKIERFPGGDDSRQMGPHINGESYCFAMINRNKRSLGVDLKSAEGREIVTTLAAEADIVVESFRPGVMKRLGLDYETLSAANPRLLYASITGFGQTGPYSGRAGFDIVAQGLTGLLRMTGQPGAPPTKVGIAVSDIAAGVTSAVALLGAYVHREKTGEGQYVDVSLVDSVLAWTIWESAALFGSGELPEPTGSRHRRSSPYQAYRTKDGYVTVGANNDRLWRRFCTDVLQRPELLDDPCYRGAQDRLAHIDELEADIEGTLVHRTTAEWVDRLDDAGVPGGPAYTYDQALADRHILAREMVIESEHPVIGRIRSLGFPIKFSSLQPTIRRPAPVLGQDTRAVLESAGWGDDDVDRLVAAGVVHDGGASNGPPHSAELTRPPTRGEQWDHSPEPPSSTCPAHSPAPTPP
jgi:crotonobetainyl-CoA:carnitine CoA-transferase CaiB-like acyl-CoA transferase